MDENLDVRQFHQLEQGVLITVCVVADTAATEWENGREEVMVLHRDGRVWSLGEGSSPTWRPN